MRRRDPPFTSIGMVGDLFAATNSLFTLGVASIDLFRCESVALRTYWVLVIMDQYTRRIIGFGIHAGVVDGWALCPCSTSDSMADGSEVLEFRS